MELNVINSRLVVTIRLLKGWESAKGPVSVMHELQYLLVTKEKNPHVLQ